jgi:ABC-type spermidine/putrescine transport system permease subunit I
MTTEVEIVPIGKPAAAQDGVDRRATAARWLLLSPAVAVVSIIGVAPMAIILVYSFLRPGYYGGVEWTFNFENYIQFLFTRDLFDETLSFDPAYLAIFGRSALQAGFATFASLLLGFPTAYYIATRRPRWRNMLAFLITIPFWTNLLIRTYAMLLLLRDDGLINSLLLATGVIKHPLQMVYTDFAIAVGLVYTYLPFMVLPIYAAIERLDFRLVEAGFDLYATRAPGPAPHHHPDCSTRHHRRRAAGVHSQPRHLHHRCAVGRRAQVDDRQSHCQSIRGIAQLAVGFGADHDPSGLRRRRPPDLHPADAETGASWLRSRVRIARPSTCAISAASRRSRCCASSSSTRR